MPGCQDENRWWVNATQYYSGDNMIAGGLPGENPGGGEVRSGIRLAESPTELTILPGDRKEINFSIQNYDDTGVTGIPFEAYINIISNGIGPGVVYEIYDVTGGKNTRLNASSNDVEFGPVRFSNSGRDEKQYRLVLYLEEGAEAASNAGKTGDFQITLVRADADQTLLGSTQKTSVKTQPYTPLVATVRQVPEGKNQFEVVVQNNNPYDIAYTISGSETFVVTYNGSSVAKEMVVSANSHATIRVDFQSQPNELYATAKRDGEGNIYATFTMYANITKPYSEEEKTIAENLMVYLEESVKNKIVANAGNIHRYEEGHRFTGPTKDNEKELCSIIDPVSKKLVYFYRGEITNNYVEFAGIKWRILRINEDDGTLRIIADDNVGTSTYANTYTANTIEKAIQALDWKKSNVYTALHNWYDTNIGSKPEYASYVVKSNYTFDTSYSVETSTAGGGECYYFGPYLRIGKDLDSYRPTFSYNNETLVEDMVGLITADEIEYAGGYWAQKNPYYFLYDENRSWTMSPSFWDNASHHKVGMFVMEPDGSASDWPGDNTLATKLGFRPVISIRGDLDMAGSGAESDPFRYE